MTDRMATPTVRVADLKDHAGKPVRVRGWLYNRRSKGKIHFLQVRDGSGIVQGVMSRGEVPDELFERCETLPYETSLSVEGAVRADARAPGGHELCLTGVEVHAVPTQEYPITKKDHGPDFLLSHRHLWLRSRKQHAILRIRDAA